MSNWHSYDNGRSIGQRGSESGTILRDEEHPDGSRITLECDGYTPYAITCGIGGWMVHTRFFSIKEEAQDAFEEMKPELLSILNLIPLTDKADDVSMKAVSSACSSFVRRFP